MKIKGSGKDSKCIYCGSTSYGPSCLYSPNKLHVHMDDPSRCVYCGSSAFGPSCVYSPKKFHIHGLQYEENIKESAERSIILGYLVRRLSEPTIDTMVYKLGIINENGDIIKLPQTVEEKAAFTNLDLYILKLKSMLGSKVDLLNNEILLSSISERISDPNSPENSVKLYETSLKLKDKFANIVAEFQEIFEEGLLAGFSTTSLEGFLIDAFNQKKC